MTEQKKRAKRPPKNPPLISPPMLAELRKARNTAAVTLSGIICITELSESEVSLASHAGRVVLRGQSLTLVIFEGGVVTVNGKIEEVSFGYAKN